MLGLDLILQLRLTYWLLFQKLMFKKLIFSSVVIHTVK